MSDQGDVAIERDCRSGPSRGIVMRRGAARGNARRLKRVAVGPRPKGYWVTPLMGLAGISLLMICNTDGASWRRPRKPANLSHWQCQVARDGSIGGSLRAWT
jgi:hypothetical protein